MEGFDVLNMGNISNFYLDHSKGRCHKHPRGGVYQFDALRAPDAAPPIFCRSHLDPPQNSVTQCTPPPNRLHGRNFLEKNFLTPPEKSKIFANFLFN